MRTTNTFSVLFWADQKNAKNNETIIYARVTVNQKRVNISVKRKVSLNLWDKKIKKARENSIEARQINQYLTQVYSQLFQCYQDLKFKGDIIYQMYSGWMSKRAYGASHGTSYTSDTHIPLLWYGTNIPNGETVKPYTITQIAPTLSFLLDIPLPNASNKTPISELFEKKLSCYNE